MEAHRLNQEIIDAPAGAARGRRPAAAASLPKIVPDPLLGVLYERYAQRAARGQAESTASRSGTRPSRSSSNRILAELGPDGRSRRADDRCRSRSAFHAVEERVVRELILDGNRPDGRGPRDLRPISCEVSVLPAAHGSAIFQRGETQALVTTVLGTGADEQRVDGIMDEYNKKFMLDYNMPLVRRRRGPADPRARAGARSATARWPSARWRRSCPTLSEFPYTIRVVSDILESNGSSSMASVCGATLSLMDAGVPITDPVGGISIGLVQDEARPAATSS